VLVIGGAILTAAGVVLYVTAPSSESPAIAAHVGPDSARLSVAGVF
jgi:hypothetical protein